MSIFQFTASSLTLSEVYKRTRKTNTGDHAAPTEKVTAKVLTVEGTQLFHSTGPTKVRRIIIIMLYYILP